MASAQNKVISGYLSGHRIIVDGCPFIVQTGNALTGARGWRIIKPDVEDYEVLSEDKVRSGTSTCCYPWPRRFIGCCIREEKRNLLCSTSMEKRTKIID